METDRLELNPLEHVERISGLFGDPVTDPLRIGCGQAADQGPPSPGRRCQAPLALPSTPEDLYCLVFAKNLFAQLPSIRHQWSVQTGRGSIFDAD